MKYFFFLFVLGLIHFSSNDIYSQKIENLELKSDGSIIYSQPTDTAATYIITVEGTYSMWPREGSNECYGVDAAYVYDVPKAEIDNLRWLPEYIEVAGQKIPIMPLPQYVGDTKVFSIPPPELGSPLFELSFRKYVGFRINDEPLPNFGIETLTHTYSFEKKGTGNPFKFQILDTNYSVIAERTLPRYDDNCGFLKIRIIEKLKPEIEFCDLKAICQDSVIVGIKVSSRIFIEDTNSITGKRNLLKNIDKNNIGIVENGKFKCNIDTILCEQKDGSAIGIVIDQSGSMKGPISESDPFSVRMESSKSALKLFANNLDDKDSVFIIGFENKVNLISDWNNKKDEIITTIDNINYIEKAQTSFYEGIIDGLNKVSQSKSINRYLLVLSDGGNTFLNGELANFERIPDSLYNIIANKSINIPIYIVALGFLKNSENDLFIDSIGRNDIRLISKVSNGKDIDVYKSVELDSIFKNLKLNLNSEDCCEIRFDIEKCKKGETRTIRLIYSPDDTTVITKVVKFDCDCPTTSIQVFDDNEDIGKIHIFPNPTNSNSNIQYKVQKNGFVNIQIFDLLGNDILNDKIYHDMPGIYYYNFETNGLKSGSYFIKLFFENTQLVNKIIVVK